MCRLIVASSFKPYHTCPATGKQNVRESASHRGFSALFVKHYHDGRAHVRSPLRHAGLSDKPALPRHRNRRPTQGQRRNAAETREND